MNPFNLKIIKADFITAGHSTEGLKLWDNNH